MSMIETISWFAVIFLAGVFCGLLTAIIVQGKRKPHIGIPAGLIVECPECEEHFQIKTARWWNLAETTGAAVTKIDNTHLAKDEEE